MEAKLARYAELLRTYAPRQNLISTKDLGSLETRHLDDSLRLVPLIEGLPEGPLIDVGSGAGLPGIPLAIALPDRHWTLLEPRQKRAAFLEEAVRILELNASVVCARAEEAARRESHAGSYHLATARALAEPPQALHLLRPFLAPGGVAALFVGQQASLPPEAELWNTGIAIVRT